MKEIEKSRETKMYLTVENENMDVPFILCVIENNLSNIHHHFMLCDFGSVYPRVFEILSTAEISLDFLENLTIFLHEKIQSVYWGEAKTEVTIHSGILTFEGNKIHHPYLSNDLSHDLLVALNEMLLDAHIDPGTILIVTNDNCCCQYKSLKNFLTHKECN